MTTPFLLFQAFKCLAIHYEPIKRQVHSNTQTLSVFLINHPFACYYNDKKKKKNIERKECSKYYVLLVQEGGNLRVFRITQITQNGTLRTTFGSTRGVSVDRFRSRTDGLYPACAPDVKRCHSAFLSRLPTTPADLFIVQPVLSSLCW